MKECDETLPSTFTTENARAHGVHPRDRDAGQIVEFPRGVFRWADALAALHHYLTTPSARPALLLEYAEALGTFAR